MAVVLCRSCFFQLRRLRSIRHSVTSEVLHTLVHAFICSRLDYCNSALFGSPKFLLDRLQSVLNAAARLLLRIPKFEHISGAIREKLHWLPIERRITFKICSIVRSCLVGEAPAYLQELCVPVTTIAGRTSLRSSTRGDLVQRRFRMERYGRRGFSVSGPALWNSLPVRIINSSTNRACSSGS